MSPTNSSTTPAQRQTNTMFTQQTVQLKAGVDTVGSNSSNLALTDCSVFYRYELTPLNPWEGSQILTAGLQTTLKVCVRNCDADNTNDREHISLRGTIYGDTVISIPPLPPPMRIGGQFELIAESKSGYWHNAFRVSCLHIRDVIAGMSLNLASIPPVPSSLTLGGSACVGIEKHCTDKTAKRHIEGGAYLGIVSFNLWSFVIGYSVINCLHSQDFNSLLQSLGHLCS